MERRRRWWIALLFGAAPPAGLLYVGRPWTFLVVIGTNLAISTMFFLGMPIVATPHIFIGLAAIQAGLLIYAVVAPVLACIIGRARQPDWPFRRLTYALGCALVWGLAAVGQSTLAPTATVRSFGPSFGSMEPALQSGDLIVADTSRERLSNLARGDVIVFTLDGGTEPFVKRLIATAGERARLVRGVPEIDGAPLEQIGVGEIELKTPSGAERLELRRETTEAGRSYLVTRRPDTAERVASEEVTVGSEELYVLGDNRENSRDSRDPSPRGMGVVKRENVLGVATGIYWSSDLSRIGRRLDR